MCVLRRRFWTHHSPIVSLWANMFLEPQLQETYSKDSDQLRFIFVYSCTDLAIDVPDFLDLSRLRASGLQASEEELPDLMPPIVLPEDTRGTEHPFYTKNSSRWK